MFGCEAEDAWPERRHAEERVELFDERQTIAAAAGDVDENEVKRREKIPHCRREWRIELMLNWSVPCRLKSLY